MQQGNKIVSSIINNSFQTCATPKNGFIYNISDDLAGPLY